ncbi:unnamed protein product [Orchesella dallaii]|uniref:Uncharacterized protein n=1 Tax=Orchesella dallaii TaxID=48710 RepID=A0ABP1QHI7_9HEXA
MIPIVRQLRMRFSPVRFFQNFLNRFAPTTTAAPPPAPAIHNPPPTVIQSSGNYQQNPIFDNNQQQPSDPNAANQGAGTFRFIMRTRMRFRNALRGNQGGGGGGGYDYTPANPATGYGTPDAAAPPPEDSGAPPPAAEGDSPPPAASQQNYYTNQAPQRNIYAGQNQNQQQHVNSNYNNIPASAAHQHQPNAAPAQRQQNFGSLPSPSTFNSGHNVNPQSFFNQPTQLSSQANLNNQQHRQISQQLYHQHKNSNQQLQPNNNNFNNNNNNNHLQPNNNFNAQATSHHQNTFVPHPQPNHQHHIQQQQPSQNTYATINTNTNRPPLAPVVATSPPPPPPIPQFKLQVEPQTLPQESLKQNFILTEEDDPHPGFTPHSTVATPPYQESFRTAARFERIGHEEPSSTVETSAAENWRDSF